MPNAVVLTRYGSPDALVWQDMPMPGPGQVRIRVMAAGVSPTDPKIRRGDLHGVFPLPDDAVLGFEAAGVVDALGPSVAGVREGDEVASLLAGLGAYGKYALTSSGTATTASGLGSAAVSGSTAAVDRPGLAGARAPESSVATPPLTVVLLPDQGGDGGQSVNG